MSYNLALLWRNSILFSVKMSNSDRLINRAIYRMMSSQFSSKMKLFLHCLLCQLTNLEYTSCKTKNTIFKIKQASKNLQFLGDIFPKYWNFLHFHLKGLTEKVNAVSLLQKYWMLPSIIDNLYNTLKTNYMCQMGLGEGRGIYLCDLQNKVKTFNHIDSPNFQK